MLYKYDTPTGPMFVSCASPDLMIIPEGMTAADAQPATEKEHEAFLTNNQKNHILNVDPLARIADLEAQLNELKTQLQHEHPSHP